MSKLNQRKVRWIIKEIDNQERSIYRIAKIQDITPQWTRELHRQYHTTSHYPCPKKSGRKPKPITEEEKKIVLAIRQQHPLNVLILEKILTEQNIHIGHNRIHRILKEEGLVKDEPHKQRRRKWVRYERRYSNSLCMLTGSNKHMNRSSSSRMTPLDSSPALAYSATPTW
jgi:transposase